MDKPSGQAFRMITRAISIRIDMSYSLNSLKGVYIGDYIDYYKGY